MLSLGGLWFEVEPEELLSAAEKRTLATLGPDASPQAALGSLPFFRVTLSAEPVWERDDFTGPRAGDPAVMDWTERCLRIRHHTFTARIDPFTCRGWLWRRPDQSFPLEATLRVALMSRLPLEGGLPLHAAAFAIDGQGIVCFGPSGAGKSTLSSLSPFPVLSDEFVAVVKGELFDVVPTGFWGTLGQGDAPHGKFPLVALIALDKGPEFALTPLAPRDAFRCALGAMLVPAVPVIWTSALSALGRLTRAVSTYRMAWSPRTPPFAALRRALTEREGPNHHVGRC